MSTYIAPDWQLIFAEQQLNTFDDFWHLTGEMVETGNERRGGWSHVIRVIMTRADGQPACMYVKRQENHRYRTWLAPFKGKATLAREFKRIMQLKEKQILTLDPLYYCEQGQRAILITKNLADYISFEQWTTSLQAKPIAFKDKIKIVQKLAQNIRQFHDHYFRHNTLYPKHIFIRLEPSGNYSVNPEFVIIDLETTKRSVSRLRALIKDLRKLHRYTPSWSRSAKLRFLKYYRGDAKLTLSDRWLIRYFE
jgi:hypothetical protein